MLRTSPISDHSSFPSRASGRNRVISGWSPTSTAESIARCLTRPITTVESPSSRVVCSSHSIATGDSATRGTATVRLGSVVSPTAANSSTSGGKSVAVAFTRSNSGSAAKFTTNSPVASTLFRLSLRPTEVNCTIGGRTHATVKNECGARLSTPPADIDDTHAIGRGTTTAFNAA